MAGGPPRGGGGGLSGLRGTRDGGRQARMVADGEWRATAPGDGRTASFHLPALLSPFETWAERRALSSPAGMIPARLQTFRNLKLGEPWEDAATAPVFADALVSRAEPCDVPWSDTLPDGVAVITAGADIQADRIELEIVGWGKGEESWSLAYEIVAGDTSRAEVWADPRPPPPPALSSSALGPGPPHRRRLYRRRLPDRRRDEVLGRAPLPPGLGDQGTGRCRNPTLA